MKPEPGPPDLHPTVEACVLRSFCDATFEAAERRLREIDRLRSALERAGRALNRAGWIDESQVVLDILNEPLNDTRTAQ